MKNDALINDSMVLVVEDNLSIANAIGLYLKNSHLQYKHCVSAEQAKLYINTHKVDLVLLDIMLPGHDGLWFIKQLKQLMNIPVIMLTAKSTEDDIIRGLQSGAIDYITKPFSSRELMARIKSHLLYSKKLHHQQQTTISIGEISLEIESMQVFNNDVPVKLTKTEYDVLFCLMMKPGVVITRSQLLTHVFGFDYAGNERSIDTHLHNLRKKVERSNFKPEYIHTVHGIGFTFEYRKQNTNLKHENIQ